MEATNDTAALKSASIGKIALALAKAQGVMGGAAKDKKNPHFGNNYADLASVWEACREPLAQNELAVVQQVTSDPNGVTVTSTLLHSSGEYISDRCWLPVTQKTPQGYGSTITYARRYSLSALVGVAQEDDDGNAGSAQTSAPAGQRSAPRQQAARKAAESKPDTKPAAGPASNPTGPGEDAESKVRSARVSQLWKKAKDEGVTKEQWAQWAEMVLNAKKTQAELTESDVDLLESAYPTLIADPEKASVIASEAGKSKDGIPF